MKNSLIFWGLVLIATACNNKSAGKSDNSNCVKSETMQAEEGATVCTDPTSTPPVEPVDTVDHLPIDSDPDEPLEENVPPQAATFKANFTYSRFTTVDKEKIREAFELIRKVVRSSEFRERVLNHTWNEIYQFADNDGQTNEQIYKKLLEGSELLTRGIDYEMDMALELYTDNTTNTVGYTYPDTTKVWMNRKYFDRYVPAQVARNIFHEWTHKLGYGHDVAVTAKRPFSVPYAIGNIIEDLAFSLP